jgi:hypothetical protein
MQLPYTLFSSRFIEQCSIPKLQHNLGAAIHLSTKLQCCELPNKSGQQYTKQQDLHTYAPLPQKAAEANNQLHTHAKLFAGIGQPSDKPHQDDASRPAQALSLQQDMASPATKTLHVSKD